MIKILSFDGDSTNKIKRDPLQDNLFNLFQKNIVRANIPLNAYLVPREFEMRLDKISNFLYGSPNYVEELMILNDIISPYSVQEGQLIYFCQERYIGNLYVKDDMSDDNKVKRSNLLKTSQSNRDKKKLTDDQNLPPNIKPSNLQQIKVSKDNKVQLINSFQ
jgi:hypothetical protein